LTQTLERETCQTQHALMGIQRQALRFNTLGVYNRFVPQHQPFEAPQPYGNVVGRNISAARGRLQASQTSLAKRMRGLGFRAWQQQTVANVEKGKRRVTVEELVGLALALDVTMRQLLEPQPIDKQIELQGGDPYDERTVRLLVAEVNGRPIWWKDDVPVRRQGWAGWEGDPDAPDAVKAAWASAPDEAQPDA
jgi:transcriptional regulator with XRE-family HTH domain